jgi:hypothetical protein
LCAEPGSELAGGDLIAALVECHAKHLLAPLEQGGALLFARGCFEEFHPDIGSEPACVFLDAGAGEDELGFADGENVDVHAG